MCIKVIRTWGSVELGIKSVWGCFLYQTLTQCVSYQPFRREINGLRPISHPNVLPIIEISETIFPFCIVSPWMLDGNIVQYTQMNPSADRLLLVRARQLKARRG